MGLTVIQSEIASSLGHQSIEELQLCLERDVKKGCPTLPSDSGSPLEWFQLAGEVHHNAMAATNGT